MCDEFTVLETVVRWWFSMVGMVTVTYLALWLMAKLAKSLKEGRQDG